MRKNEFAAYGFTICCTLILMFYADAKFQVSLLNLSEAIEHLYADMRRSGYDMGWDDRRRAAQHVAYDGGLQGSRLFRDELLGDLLSRELVNNDIFTFLDMNPRFRQDLARLTDLQETVSYRRTVYHLAWVSGLTLFLLIVVIFRFSSIKNLRRASPPESGPYELEEVRGPL